MSKTHSTVSRPIDKLGRITLPIELRQELNIEPGDRLNLFLDGRTILLQKRDPECTICGEKRRLVAFRDRHVCPDCLAALQGIELP